MSNFSEMNISGRAGIRPDVDLVQKIQPSVAACCCPPHTHVHTHTHYHHHIHVPVPLSAHNR